MPRIPRGDTAGEVQHIISRGNARMAVFHDAEDYSKFLALLKEFKKLHGIEVYAYCLMPNHFHLALKSLNEGSVSPFMQKLMTTYVRYHHHKYKASGHLWQGRYKNFLVQKEGYLWMLLRYIEANPVRAGLVKNAAEWPYGSLAEREKKSARGLLDRAPVELPANWADEVHTPLEPGLLDAIRTSVNRQAPLGTDDWCWLQARKHGLEASMRPVGRPRNKKI
ncbi:MAG: transposase [Campylobacterales bacterium]